MVEKRIKLLQYDKKIHLPGEDHTPESVSFTTLIGNAEWSFPPTGWVLIPRGLYRLGDPDPLGRQHSECRTPFRVSLRSFSYPVSLHDTLSAD